jgi:hypothetical protein
VTKESVLPFVFALIFALISAEMRVKIKVKIRVKTKGNASSAYHSESGGYSSRPFVMPATNAHP